MTDTISLDTHAMTSQILHRIKDIDERTKDIDERTKNIDERTKNIDERTKKTCNSVFMQQRSFDADTSIDSVPVVERCLPGTRLDFRDEISSWVQDAHNSPEILLLLGQAGSGKSAIAHSIFELFRGRNQLGSFISFKRNKKKKGAGANLFSVISRHLGHGNTTWQQALGPLLKKSCTSSDLSSQLQTFIAEPAKNLESTEPIVIILDGLDAIDLSCPTSVLDALRGLGSQDQWGLPSNYRFFITSRTEIEFERWCGKLGEKDREHIICRRMADIDEDETDLDLQIYFTHHLEDASKILDKVDPNWVVCLAQLAETNFQWARNACRYINQADVSIQLVGAGLMERFNDIKRRAKQPLFPLYSEILNKTKEFEIAGYLESFKTVMLTLIDRRNQTTSFQTLETLLNEEIRTSVRHVMEPLHPLFSGLDDPQAPIRPIHTSLFTFFLTPLIGDEEKQVKNRFSVLGDPSICQVL